MSKYDLKEISGAKAYNYPATAMQQLKDWAESFDLMPNSIMEISYQDALSANGIAKCFSQNGVQNYYQPSGDNAQYLNGCNGHFYLSMSATENLGNTYSFHMCRPDFENGKVVVNHDTITFSGNCEGSFVPSAAKVHHAPAPMNAHEDWSAFLNTISDFTPNQVVSFDDLTPNQKTRFVGSHEFDNRVLEKFDYLGCFSKDVDSLKKDENDNNN